MERVTCVVDATTLVDTIHEIKQWVYNGSVRIHISLQSMAIMVQQLGVRLTGFQLLKKSRRFTKRHL